jgi:hypothetical protein
MKILLRDFNEKLGGEDIFKPTFGNESLLQDGNDNGVRMVNFTAVNSTMLRHRNIHKYTWTSPGGKTHNQIHHTLIGDFIRIYSMYLPFRGADCDTDHCLVVAKVRE